MVEQLSTSRHGASPTVVVGKTLLACAMVLAVLFAIPVAVDLLSGLWQHAGLVLSFVAAFAGLVLVAVRLAKRRA
jgi:hypothetical protein